MSHSVKATNQEKKDENISLNVFPDKCAICGKHGQPEFQNAAFNIPKNSVHAVFRCPVDQCRALYIGLYKIIERSGLNATRCLLQSTTLGVTSETKTFQENIEKLSAFFVTTYNQALTAEENGLDQICGPGFRKALEFLIKDYLISYKYKDDVDKQTEVKKLFLGKAIEDHISEDRIKTFAKRAVWIGNDETHYTRKWEDKDINDLKALIRITVDHIDLTIESDRYLAEMPEAKSS